MEFFDETASIADLRNMYKATQSTEIVDYVYRTRGIKGLLSLDMSLAIGVVSDLLCKDINVIKNELQALTGTQYDTFLRLTIEVILNIKGDMEADERCDNFLEILKMLNFHTEEANNRRYTKIFIATLLNYYTSQQRLVESDATDDIPVITLEQIIDSLVYNPSLTEEDIFGWLAENPNVAKAYIIKYRDIQDSFAEPSDDLEFLYRDGVLSFGKVLQLLVSYKDILEQYNNNTSHPINILEELVDIIKELISEISDYYIPNCLTSIAIGKLFIEAGYSINNVLNPIVKDINTLFWNVWLKINYPFILEEYQHVNSYKFFRLFQDDFNKINDFYLYQTEVRYDPQSGYYIDVEVDIDCNTKEEVLEYLNDTLVFKNRNIESMDLYEMSNNINQRTNDGLIYAIYFNDIYRNDPIIHHDVEFECKDQDILESLDRLINNGVIPVEFSVTPPTEYVDKILPALYPDVDLFMSDSEKEQKKVVVPKDESVDAILDTMI